MGIASSNFIYIYIYINRFWAHFQKIKSKNVNYDVSRHFNQTDHKCVEDIKIYILDFIYMHPRCADASHLRDIIEFHWIH